MSNINNQYLFYEDEIDDKLNSAHKWHHYFKAAQNLTNRYVDDGKLAVPVNQLALNHISPIAKWSSDKFIFPVDLVTSAAIHSTISGGLSGISRGLAGRQLAKFRKLELEKRKKDPNYHRKHYFARSRGIKIFQGNKITDLIGGKEAEVKFRKNRILHNINKAAGNIYRVYDNIQTVPGKFLQKTISNKLNPGEKYLKQVNLGPIKMKIPKYHAHTWNQSGVFRGVFHGIGNAARAGASIPYETVKHLAVRHNNYQFTPKLSLKNVVHSHLLWHPEHRETAKSIAQGVMKLQRKLEHIGRGPKIGKPIGQRTAQPTVQSTTKK